MSEEALQDRVALVTGGASGIGRATAHALAAAGARIAVVDRDATGAEQAAEEIRQDGARAKAFAVDLADASAIDPAVEAVIAEFGRIDILVNAAGISTHVGIVESSEEIFDRIIAVNLKAPFLLTRAVGRHMIERGGGGRIINLSSSAGSRATAAPAAYAASKAAINGLTRSCAADLGPHDVNVNAVAPGMTKTPMTTGIGDDEAYQRIVSSGPLANLLQRPSEAEDVANVVLFLCLPQSRQITGQVIHTSAGQVV
jgi:NAD(P)-dependent dehydrogenase (short-subunit alcohol dehydrogenase family)